MDVSSVTATPRWKQPGSRGHFHIHSFLLFLSLTPNGRTQGFKEITLTGLAELLSYHNWDLGLGTGMSKGHCVINEYTTALGLSLLCQLQTFSKLCVHNAKQIRKLRKSKNMSSLSSQNPSVNESGSLSFIYWDFFPVKVFKGKLTDFNASTHSRNGHALEQLSTHLEMTECSPGQLGN